MRSKTPHRAFTMTELLVVIAILALLVALLFPVLESARQSGRVAACSSNLRQIGAAIASYAGDNDLKLPYGPKAPPFTSPSDLYPSTGAPTSLLSLRNGAPAGLGLLLKKYLSDEPRVLFCPGNDQPIDANKELAKVGKKQAQCSYFYRHGGSTDLFDPPNMPGEPPHIRLSNLGLNRNEKPIRAIVMDTLFLCPPDLDQFNVKPRTNHRGKVANILFADGHVTSRSNDDGSFTVDVRDFAQLRSSFSRILTAFEKADELP